MTERDPVARATAAGVLRAMERRAPLAPDRTHAPLRLAPRRLPALRAQPLDVLKRMVHLLAVGGRLALDLTRDRARGPVSARLLGQRLREALERMGGIAVKIGQQLAIRMDLLPPDLCDELAKLSDAVAPFPTEVATARIEAELGRPMAELFESFDPKPIGSASIACVYQARLRGGEKVAVKVQRPDVARRMGADLLLLDEMTRLMERLTIVRPEMFTHFRSEVRQMLTEELDFRAEASFQRMFPRNLRKSRITWCRAPKVYSELCSQGVIVSEFVDAVPSAEVLEAVEGRDDAALERLRARGIHPPDLARRLTTLTFWNQMEALFFHADPHPGNVLIEEGGRLVLIDFGACGATTPARRRQAGEQLRRFDEDHPADASEAGLLLILPLPHLDTDELRRGAIEVWGDFYFDLQDPDAPWWARTSTGVWLAFMKYAQRLNIQINRATLHMVRASFLYDTLALRFHDELPATVLNDYIRGLMKRLARAQRRRARRAARELPASAIAPLLRWQRVAERALASGAMTPAVDLRRGLSRGAAALRVGVFTVAAVGAAWAVTSARLAGQAFAEGEALRLSHLPALAAEAARSPALLAAIALILFLSLRHLGFVLRRGRRGGRRGGLGGRRP